LGEAEESAPLLSQEQNNVRYNPGRSHEDLLGLHHVEQVATPLCRDDQHPGQARIPTQKQAVSGKLYGTVPVRHDWFGMNLIHTSSAPGFLRKAAGSRDQSLAAGKEADTDSCRKY
jgi:hypothetical protein